MFKLLGVCSVYWICRLVIYLFISSVRLYSGIASFRIFIVYSLFNLLLVLQKVPIYSCVFQLAYGAYFYLFFFSAYSFNT